MAVYVEVQSALVNRRVQEYNATAESAAAQALATENVAAETVVQAQTVEH